MGKTPENVILGAHCKGNFKLLSEISLRINYHFASFFMDFTQ